MAKLIYITFLTLFLGSSLAMAQDTIPAMELVQATPIVTESSATVQDPSFMEKLTAFCLENLNYGTVTLFMAIESSFIPFPSEAVVPPAAWKATVTGEMNILLVILFATIGAITGALVNYFLALWFGRPIIYKFANSRIGHMCLIDEDKVKYAEEYFDKHGAISTIIGRLVPAVRQLISIPAGLARMGLGRFLLFTTLGAGIWNIILAVLGYWMSKIPGMDSEAAVMAAVKEHSTVIGYAFIVLAAFIIGFLIYEGSKGGKK
jgi:membrane protein DedA with SNARE-associated domain